MPCFGKSQALLDAEQRHQDQDIAMKGLQAELEKKKEELAEAKQETYTLRESQHQLELQCDALRDDIKNEEAETEKAKDETKALRALIAPSSRRIVKNAGILLDDPCRRAISLGDLMGFFTSHCGKVASIDGQGKDPIYLPHTLARACGEFNQKNRSAIMRGELRMISPNTYAVDDLIISKLTKSEKVSLAELWHRDGLLAETFVSHWWGQDFGEVCQTIHQLMSNDSSMLHPGLSQDDLDTHVRGLTLWISAFSCNRWNLSCELGESVTTSLFHRVLESASTKQMLLCIDTSAFVLQRAWCCTEFSIACGFKKDVVFATRFGSLHQLPVNTLPCSLLVSHLALSLDSINIQKAVTSIDQDFEMLKEKAKEVGMDEFNRDLQKSFAEVLLPLAARAGDVSSITTLIEKGATPDAMDRRGIYAMTHATLLYGESSNTVQTLLKCGADRRALPRAADVMRMFDKENSTREEALQLMKALPAEERTFHAAAIEAAEAEFANLVAKSTLFEKSVGDPRRKEEALKCLGRLGDKAAQHVSAIALCLFDEHPAIREAALEVLIGTGENVTAHVVHHLRDKERGMRAAAVELLGKCGPAALPHLGEVAELLEDYEWRVRKAACEALGAVGAPSAAHVGSVAKCLHDNNGDVRTAAIWSLGKLGDLSAPHASKIADCLGDEQLQVRVAAKEVLERIKP